MDSYFDQIQQQLVERCEQGTHRRFRASRGLMPVGRSGVLLAASVLVLVAEIVVALSVCSERQHQGASVPLTALPRCQQQQVARYVSAATPLHRKSCLMAPAETRLSKGRLTRPCCRSWASRVVRRPA